MCLHKHSLGHYKQPLADTIKSNSRRMYCRKCGNCLLYSVVCCKSLQTVWTQIRPDKMSGLIWIQTVRHSDDNPERVFLIGASLWYIIVYASCDISDVHVQSLAYLPKIGMYMQTHAIFEALSFSRCGKCSKTLFLKKCGFQGWNSQNACQNSKQGWPWSDCFFRSSLIWVCTVFL